MDAAEAKRSNFGLLLQTKSNFPSRPIKRLARQEVQLSCFLLASENSDQMIRFNLFRFVEKSAVPFVQKKLSKIPFKW